MKLFLKISFLGSKYCGYQVQSNAPTVQEKLNEASKRLFGFDCDIVGCSRTDSGVHAKEFCVTVSQKGTDELIHSIPQEKIPTAFNSLLPDDIAVNQAFMVDSSFHARYDVKYKEYVYLIWNGANKDPFVSDRSYRAAFHINEAMIEKMDKAAKLLVGKHDFSSFMATGSKITDTHRTVFYADVSQKDNMITFRVAADGFLYNMVRIMVGTLLEVARANIECEDISRIIEAHDRTKAGATAPACGLYLNKVSYQNYKSEVI